MNLCIRLLVAAASYFVAADATSLTILHVNDHHSHLEVDSASLNIYGDDIPAEVSSNNGGTTYIRAYYGGYPRIVTAFKALESEAVEKGRDVLKLHAGDAITGTTFFTLFKGDADARMMTHVCFDAFAPGNHEFDEGDAGLAKFLTALKTEANASSTCDEMPAVLGGNIVPHSESALLEPDVPDIEAYSVFTMSDGEEVGVIGITVARKTMESSQPDEGTFLLDEKETTAAAVEELTAMGVNKIIVITHIGMQNDIEWLGSLEGVDVVVGGDSHSLLGDNATAVIGSTRGSYATVVEKPDGTLTCIVQAWDYSKLVGNLDVDFDEDGNVISCTGSPVFPFNPDTVVVRDADPRYDMSAEDAAAVIASLVEKTEGQARPIEADADALADMEVYGLELEELTQAVVGTVSAPIGLEGAPYESGACDLVAQSFILNPLATADVAIQNRGGCRSSIDEGEFTINDAYTLLPFANTMVNLVMTGEEIKNVLEDAVDFYLDPTGSWGAYPKTSGLRFDVNEALPKGSRISNMEVNAKLAGSWEAIDMSATYTVVTNSFIAGSRDGYYEYGNIAEELIEDTYVEYAQQFIDYSLGVGTLEPVAAENASTQNWSNTTDAPSEAPEDPFVAPTAEEPEEEEAPWSDEASGVASSGYAVSILFAMLCIALGL